MALRPGGLSAPEGKTGCVFYGGGFAPLCLSLSCPFGDEDLAVFLGFLPYLFRQGICSRFARTDANRVKYYVLASLELPLT